MIPVAIFAGRDVAVFGLGISGIAAAHALAAGGSRVLAWDDTAAARDKAATQGVTLHDLALADWSTIAALVLAPGISLTHPEPHWSVKKAGQGGRHHRHQRQVHYYGAHRPSVAGWGQGRCAWRQYRPRRARPSALRRRPHLRARAVDVPNRYHTAACSTRCGAAQHHAGSPRPSRHHGDLCGH